MKPINFLCIAFLLYAHSQLAMNNDETLSQGLDGSLDSTPSIDAQLHPSPTEQNRTFCLNFCLSNAVASTLAGTAFGSIGAPLLLCNTLAQWYTFKECDLLNSKGDESQLRLMGMGAALGAATGLTAGSLIIFPLAYIASKGISCCKKLWHPHP